MSISKVIPMIDGLVHYVNDCNFNSDFAKNLQSELLRGLNTRLHNIQYNPALSKATFLDPRYKRHGFTDSSAVNKTKELLTTEINKILNENQTEELN